MGATCPAGKFALSGKHLIMKKHSFEEFLIAPITVPVAALSSFILIMATVLIHLGLAMILSFLFPVVLSPLLALRLIGKREFEKPDKPKKYYKKPQPGRKP